MAKMLFCHMSGFLANRSMIETPPTDVILRCVVGVRIAKKLKLNRLRVRC